MTKLDFSGILAHINTFDRLLKKPIIDIDFGDRCVKLSNEDEVVIKIDNDGWAKIPLFYLVELMDKQ